MRLFNFLRFVVDFRKANIDLLQEFWFRQSITLGKIGHHNLILTELAPDDIDTYLFRYKKDKKKIRFATEIESQKIASIFFEPKDPSTDIEDSFSLYSTKKCRLKNDGMIFRNPGSQTNRFYFVRNKTFQKYQQLMGIKIRGQ